MKNDSKLKHFINGFWWIIFHPEVLQIFVKAFCIQFINLHTKMSNCAIYKISAVLVEQIIKNSRNCIAFQVLFIFLV